MMAPVMILTHWPGAATPRQAAPAKAVPSARCSVSGWPGWRRAPSKAKPSMAELSCGGTLMGETTSCASTRPSAANTPTVSVSLTGWTRRARNSLTLAAGRALGS